MADLLERARSYYERYGLFPLLWRISREPARRREYLAYDGFARALAPTAEELQRQREYPFAEKPLVTVAVPAYNTPPRYLHELVDSVLAQSYENWELVIADGCSPKEESREALRQEAERDGRIRVLFLDTNGGISANTNAALAAAKGDFIVFSDHDDLLTPDALYELVRCFRDTQADFVYSDEDKIDEASRRLHTPHFKPDYSYHYLLCTNYMCHISAVRRAKLAEVGPLDPAFDGSQDHDFNLRCAERGLKIVHIPKVLYHWRYFRRSVSNTAGEKCADAARDLVQRHLDRCGIPAKAERARIGNCVRYRLQGRPLVSVVTSGDAEPLLAKTDYKNLELCASPAEAKGEYLLFLSEGILPEEGAWLETLLAAAQQKGVSGVSGRLESANGRISYVGAYFAGGKLVYPYYDLPNNELGYMIRNLCTHEVGALCPEFCLVRSGEFRASGASDAVEFSLRAPGVCLYLPHVLARRGGKNPAVPAGQDRAYAPPFAEDPTYSPNLSRSAPFLLRRELQENRKGKHPLC